MATAKPVKKLHRLGSDDFSTAEAVLKAAALLIVPDNQTQKQAFDRLMPHLYALRNRGCSIEQITSLLANLNFKLQPSAVRVYFAEGLAERMDKCQESMNEQILLLAEVRKQTKGADVSSISERVAAIMERQRTAAASKLDSLFGGSSATPLAKTAAVASNEAVKPRLAENKNSGLRRTPLSTPPAEDDSGSFGLLNLKPAARKCTKAPAFFSQEDSPPVIPDLQIAKAVSGNTNSGLRPGTALSTLDSTAESKSSQKAGLRCLALKNGPQKLKARDNVPSEIYLSGDLEHPKIAGLMLSLDERIYGAALEYADESGEVKLETPDEKRFRVLWKRPVAMFPTRTGDSFTKMDESSYKAISA